MRRLHNRTPFLGLGRVEGRVLDSETGRPLPKATVTAEPDDVASTGKPISALTADNGDFAMNLAAGHYVMAGSKEEDFYPNTDYAAFAFDLTVLPHVAISEGKTVSGVLIPLKRGASLVGTIVDSNTKSGSSITDTFDKS